MRRFFIVSLFFLTGCLEGGGGDVTAPAGSSGDNGGLSPSVAITSIQGLASSNWIVDGSGNVYTKNNTLVIEGTCSRGIAKIAATVNSVDVSETAVCDINGKYSWTKIFASTTAETGDTYSIILKAKNTLDAEISGIILSKSIVVDTNAPDAPIVDPVASCSLSSGIYVCYSGNYSVTATFASDVSRVVQTVIPLTNAQGTLTRTSATTLNLDSNFAEGAQVNVSFIAYDLSGNASPSSAAVLIAYIPTVQLLGSSVSGGGSYGPSGSPFSGTFGNPTMVGSMASMVGVFTDTNSVLPAEDSSQMHLGPIAVGARQLNP